jgi:FAD/FMN-containing dehydrogenase
MTASTETALSARHEGVSLATRTSRLDDYGSYHRSAAGFHELENPTVQALRSTLRFANKHGVRVRARGNGHSMNGSSLPRKDEILLRSDGLDYFQFAAEGTVTVGAGAVVWDVNQELMRRGFELHLVNDGGAATATVGGFISAGGIGDTTWLCGGFWETVLSITLITPTGELVVLGRSDEMFRWMFGSMGQLGFIVEATLRIRAVDGERRPYPHGAQGCVERSDTDWERNFWLTLFVPEEDARVAEATLAALANRHDRAWVPREDYLYFVRFHEFNPPLIYPAQESFVAMGIWGSAPGADHVFDFDALRVLESGFAHLVRSRPRFRRYIQAELSFERPDFRTVFGAEVYDEFLRLKRQVDPNMIFNRGVVFPDERPSGAVSRSAHATA